jgi:hypothetical protein
MSGSGCGTTSKGRGRSKTVFSVFASRSLVQTQPAVTIVVRRTGILAQIASGGASAIQTRPP